MPTTEVLKSRRAETQKRADRRFHAAVRRRVDNIHRGEEKPANNIPEKYDYRKGIGQIGDQDLVLLTPEGLGRTSAFASHRLDQVHPEIEVLDIVQHGITRNTGDYFDFLERAQAKNIPASELKRILSFSQYFPAVVDQVGDEYVKYGVRKWPYGEPAERPDAPISAYSLKEAAIRHLVDHVAPNTRKIRLYNNSAGAQMDLRFAFSTVLMELEERGIEVEIWDSNPGSVIYPDTRRLENVKGFKDAYNWINVAEKSPENSWPYGLHDAPPWVDAFFERFKTREEAILYAKRALVRRTRLAYGDLDVKDEVLQDDPGYQGATRRERAKKYGVVLRRIGEEIGEEFDPEERIIRVEGVDHDGEKMLSRLVQSPYNDSFRPSEKESEVPEITLQHLRPVPPLEKSSQREQTIIGSHTGEPEFMNPPTDEIPYVLLKGKYKMINAKNATNGRGEPNALELILGLREKNRIERLSDPRFRGQYAKYFPSLGEHKRRTQEKIDAGHFLLVYDDEDPTKAIACAGFSYDADEWLYRPGFHKDPAFYVSQRYVDPEYNGQGIGAEIVDHLNAFGRRIGAKYRRNEAWTKNDLLYNKYIQEGREAVDEFETQYLAFVSPAAQIFEQDIQPQIHPDILYGKSIQRRRKLMGFYVETRSNFDKRVQRYEELRASQKDNFRYATFAELFLLENPFAVVPELVPSMYLGRKRIFKKGHSYNSGNEWWLRPLGEENDIAKGDFGSMLTAYFDYDEFVELKRTIGLASFVCETPFYPINRNLVEEVPDVAKFATAVADLEFRAPTERLGRDANYETVIKALERPIDTREGFVKAWFGFEHLRKFEGNGPLLQGTINRSGNLMLDDGTCFYLSDCNVTSKEIPPGEFPKTILQDYTLQEGDFVHVRLTMPPVPHGEVAQIHANVLKMDLVYEDA